MIRVLRNTPTTLAVSVEVDGVGTDPSPDESTVTVTRADGTAVVTDAAAINQADGVFSYNLAAAENDRLDVLTATWTTPLGTFVTETEVVGGFLFSVSELTDMLTSSRVTGTYTVDQIIEIRTLAEEALEDACGVAFVPRYTQTTVSGTGGTVMLLAPRTTALRAVSVDGVAQTVTDEAFDATTGAVYWPDTWTAGTSNIVVGYEHGYRYPPARVKRAALLLAKSWLIAGPIDDRTTSLSTEDGTFSLATPGVRGSVFGIPEVDATVQQYSVRVGIA